MLTQAIHLEAIKHLYKLSRLTRFGVNVGGTQVLSTDLFNRTLVFDTRDWQSIRTFYLTSPSELGLLALIGELIQPGMRCADIGAGCGYYSLALSIAVGDNGHVDSFEPIEENCELLERNMVTHQRSNVTLNRGSIAKGDVVWDDKLWQSSRVCQLAQDYDFYRIGPAQPLKETLEALKPKLRVNPQASVSCYFNPDKDDGDLLSNLSELGFHFYLFPNLDEIEAEQLLSSTLPQLIYLRRENDV